MTPLRLLAAFGALCTTPLAFAQNQNENRVWAVVAYVHRGDSVPELSSRPAVLIPNGAQQMARQGMAFRSRYLNGTRDADSPTTNSSAVTPIYGMEPSALDNSQVLVMAAEDEASVGSALAFLQGLYPPATREYSTLAGGEEIARNLAGNENTSSLMEYPLGGYQYPRLQIPSTSDENSPSVQGTVGCTAWTSETNSTLREQKDMRDLYDKSASFYQTIFTSGPLKGTVPSASANFWNANEIYNYVNYMYTHDESTHKQLSNANETLAQLREYAYAIQRGKLTKPQVGKSDEEDRVYTVAGRSLASKIIGQFDSVIANRASRSQLTLLFGSMEPMLSFFSISGLLNRENLNSGAFSSLPQPGSVMVFELIGDVPKKYETNLDPEKLRIRFSYRASADKSEEFTSYALFDAGYGGSTVPYTTFSRQLSRMSINSTAWCEVCSATASPWCRLGSGSGDIDSSGMFQGRRGMHPAVAGVIGALAMALVTGLTVVALYMLAGLRLRRAGEDERKSAFGGFKREEKRPSDADVDVTREGVHHERVGSWELHGNEPPMQGLGGIVSKNFSRSAARRVDDDDDQISILGTKPAAVREAL